MWQFKYYPVELRLKHTFTVAVHSRKTTPLVLCELSDGHITGRGEASLPPYLGATQENVIAFLEKVDVQQLPVDFDQRQLLDLLNMYYPESAPAKACLDIAWHDFMGQQLGMPLWQIFGAKQENMPDTCLTIGIDSPEMIRQKVAESADFNILKVKLGTDDDRNIIETIREITAKPLMVDANQGWKSKEEALELCHWLSEHGVILVEQPFPKDRTEDQAWLKRKSPLPLIADESFQGYNDLSKVKAGFHGVNIKLMKCGGIAEALRIIRHAGDLGLELMIGCMTETSCAVMAAAQLAPFCRWADLDGPFLSSNNPFEMPVLKNGKLPLAELPGLGIKLIKNAL